LSATWWLEEGSWQWFRNYWLVIVWN